MGIFSSIGKAFTSGNPILGAGITAVGGLLSANANNQASLQAQQLANQGNMELAKYAYQQDLEMWNRQNAYNTPSAQMQRYREAGLNPNLIYGSGSSAGNATNAPSFNPSHINPEIKRTPDYGAIIGSAIGQYNQLRLQQAQLENLQANTNNLGYQAAYNDARGLLAKQQYGFNGLYNPYRIDLAAQSISNMKVAASTMASRMENMAMERQLIEAQIASLKASTDIKGYEKDFLMKSFGLRLALINAKLKLFNANANTAWKEWESFRDTGASSKDFNSGWQRGLYRLGVGAYNTVSNWLHGNSPALKGVLNDPMEYNGINF